MSIKMTTRRLAQICETEHKELLKRMRKAIERGAKEEWFEETFYITNNNRRCPEYLLTYDGAVAILECMSKGLRDNVMHLVKEHFGVEMDVPSTGTESFKVPPAVEEGIKKLRKRLKNKKEEQEQQEVNIIIDNATIFNSPEFGQVRVIVKNNEPWFVAMDIAKILNYSDAEAMCRRLDEDEYRVFTPTDLQNVGHSNQINPVFRYLAINESGLYNAIFGSEKPEAKKFRKWVTEEVLPTIRRTGGYVANEDLFIDTYLKHADETTKLMFKGVLETVRRQNEQIERQRKELDHKEDVIIGLIDQISLAEKRQILNRVVRKGGSNYSERWNELYRQFEMKYHIDLARRIRGHNAHNEEKIKSKLDYIDKVMGKLPELYEIACKIYESDVKELVKELYSISNANKEE